MHPIVEVKKEVDPESHKGPVPAVQPLGGKEVKAEVVEDHGEQPVGPIVGGQMELGDDPEMLEVAQILVDMGKIHREIEAKKKRKVYAAAYRKRKAAEKKAMNQEIAGKKIKTEETVGDFINHSFENAAAQTTTFFGVTSAFRVDTEPLNLN